MLILFWSCLAMVAWVYLGYPLALRAGLLGRKKAYSCEPIQPSISIIIPAHNEERAIKAKLENLLASDYPRERVEILVGSDGSSDSTEEIVRHFAADGVGFVSFPIHRGKSAIQNALAAVASGSILVLTDADCLFLPETLQHLVEGFADARVGLVTGHPAYINKAQTGVTTNEGVYLGYETWLRQEESVRGLLAMASGSLFAMRRSLWQPLDRDLGDDFELPLRMAENGQRNVLEARAVTFTQLTQSEPLAMFGLKVRIISKDFRALLSHRRLLNPFRHGTLAISLWSHKLLRWLVPYFLIGMLASSLFLQDRPFFRVFAALQLVLYLTAVAGLLLPDRARRFPWSIPMSFCVVNLAALVGTLKCIMGGKSGRWTPERKQLHVP